MRNPQVGELEYMVGFDGLAFGLRPVELTLDFGWLGRTVGHDPIEAVGLPLKDILDKSACLRWLVFGLAHSRVVRTRCNAEPGFDGHQILINSVYIVSFALGFTT